MPAEQRRPWALRLYRKSVLKQAKFAAIRSLMDDPEGQRCLDIGGDNGVISYLLRESGGSWVSADLDEASVQAIRSVVGDGVHRIDGRTTPFEADTFDQIVIVDFLEHIHTDREFVRELERILRGKGLLIVNVPNLKPRSMLNRIRPLLGLTDEKHGHVRPGYSLSELGALLGESFTIERHATYSRTPLESLDIALNALLEVQRSRRAGNDRSRKGALMTREETERLGKQLRLLSLLYPLFRVVLAVDRAWPARIGYKLVVRARLSPARS